jgi:hypothetical protein
VGTDKVSSVEAVFQTVYDSTRTTPKEWGAPNDDARRLEPFYIDLGQSPPVVTVPSDVESFADDPVVRTAIVACMAIKAKIIIGKPMNDEPLYYVRAHPDTVGYYEGISAAIRKGETSSFPNYSGWFGKGYNSMMKWVISSAGIAPWCLRGNSESLRKVWTHKKWGEKLPVFYKHLEVLIKSAKDTIKLTEGSVPSWCTSIDTLRGRQLKKNPSYKPGILTQTDIDALDFRFKNDLADWKNQCKKLQNPSLELMKSLDETIKQANASLRNYESTADTIIDSRAKILFAPIPGIKRNKTKKEKISDKVRRVDIFVYINKFSPCTALGITPFTVTEPSDKVESRESYVRAIQDQFDSYLKKQHSDYADFLLSWWNTDVLPRISEDL